MEGIDLEGIDEKLHEYREHLAAVEEALAGGSENEELSRIRADLQEVISVFTDLHSIRTAEAQAVAASEKASLVGRSVQLKLSGVAVVGEVEAVVDGVLHVTVPGETQARRVPEAEADVLHSSGSWSPGTHCEAVYADDGMWYPAEVVGLGDDDMVRVLFTEYDEEALVRSDRVRMPARRPAKIEVKEIITPGGYRIPENLQIKPQDSEKRKQIKKRRINELKKAQRQEQVVKAYRDKQSDWTKHLKKNAGRTGALTQAARAPVYRKS